MPSEKQSGMGECGQHGSVRHAGPAELQECKEGRGAIKKQLKMEGLWENQSEKIWGLAGITEMSSRHGANCRRNRIYCSLSEGRMQWRPVGGLHPLHGLCLPCSACTRTVCRPCHITEHSGISVLKFRNFMFFSQPNMTQILILIL